MSSESKIRVWSISSACLILLATLGCSLLSQLSSREQAQLPPTRTPLPTFTPTPIFEQPISALPTPTETVPAPPSPEPPTPTAQPAPSDTPLPEPTATDTPLPPPPTEVPSLPPVEPAPAEPPPPPPPAEPAVGPNGVIGKLEFRDGRNVYAVGEKVFVRIEASTASGAGQISFGILGLTTSSGAFQTSWSKGTISGTFRHEDGVAFSAPGAHKLWLSICFSTLEICQGADGNWERFEPGLDVVVQ